LRSSDRKRSAIIDAARQGAVVLRFLESYRLLRIARAEARRHFATASTSTPNAPALSARPAALASYTRSSRSIASAFAPADALGVPTGSSPSMTGVRARAPPCRGGRAQPACGRRRGVSCARRPPVRRSSLSRNTMSFERRFAAFPSRLASGARERTASRYARQRPAEGEDFRYVRTTGYGMS
jgi:hypothetical protein